MEFGNDEKRPYVRMVRDEMVSYAQELMVENEKLRLQLDAIAAENQKWANRFQEIEQHSANLANLYVSSYQLHSTVELEGVLGSILEIVINLIGSEEVAIFQLDESGKIEVAASFGVDNREMAALAAGGTIAATLAGGELFVSKSGTSYDGLTSCIPLKINDSVRGAIAIFSLLPHKSALEPVDFELFDLLAAHAATALYCATLHARSSQGVPA